MKILSTFTSLGTVTSSGANAAFPATNIQNLKPMVRWVASAYAGDVWLKADLGSAKVLTAAFLNQANFPLCKIQGHASDDWGSPSFSMDCAPLLDDADNRKGWFDLVAFNYRWIRVLIASGQTLDKSETVPALGNLLVGTSSALPAVSSFEPRLVKRFDRFESDGGALDKEPRGRARHIIAVSCEDALATVRSMNKTWTDAVIFADWGNAAEAWLVFPPEEWGKPIQVGSDFQLKFTCEERP